MAYSHLLQTVGIQVIVLLAVVLLGDRCLESVAKSLKNGTSQGTPDPQSHSNETSISSPGGVQTGISESHPSQDEGEESEGSLRGYKYNGPPVAESSRILYILLQPYDKRIRPNLGGPATVVECGIYVLSMDEVTEVTMDYGMTILLEETWNDPRLAFANYTSLPVISSGMGVAERIWVPDLFFANEKRASFHSVTVHNRLIRVYPNGDIFYSMKLSLVLYCHMDFKAFPMDKQRCKTAIESYQSTEDELLIKWSEHAVVMGPEISLPQYSMQPLIPFGTCTNRVSTGPTKANFSCIQFSFTLVRELTFYIIQTYIPTSLLVLISWVSFWIDIGQAAARVSLGVTTVLTMTTTTVGYGAFAGLPKVSYTKAIDLWFDACLSFVIGSLFEYAIVHYLWTRDKAEKLIRWAASRDSFKEPSPYDKHKSQNHCNSYSSNKAPSSRDYSDHDPDSDSNNRFGSRYNYHTSYRTVRKNSYGSQDGDVETAYSKLQQQGLADRKRTKLFALRIDRMSRVLFPLAFCTFAGTYWVCYYRIYVADFGDL